MSVRAADKTFAKFDINATLTHLGSDIIRESSGILSTKKKVLPNIKNEITNKKLPDLSRSKKSTSLAHSQSQEHDTLDDNLTTYEMGGDMSQDYEMGGDMSQDGLSSSPKAPSLSRKQNSEDDIPPTKIPEKYHIIDQHPIRPKNDQNIAYSDVGWVRKWFPSEKPSGRREWIDSMLAEIAEENTIYSIEKEQQIYDVVLHEIIRQISVECADRGKLLDVVSKRYKRLFARIPSILSELQQEIDGLVDANKSLRMLLERLMEEKSIIEHHLKDTKAKDDNLAEQNISFSAEILRYKKTIQHLAQKTNVFPLVTKTPIYNSLIEEKDAAIEEAKRQQERHHYQEKLNVELLDRDEFNKSIIKKMGDQLEDAINSLHAMEAKYLASVAQNRTTRMESQFFLDDSGVSKHSVAKNLSDIKPDIPAVQDIISVQTTKPGFDGDDIVVGTRPKSAPAELSTRKSRLTTAATIRQHKQKTASAQKKKHSTPYPPSPTSSPATPIALPPTRSTPALSSRMRPSPALTPDEKRRSQKAL